MNNVYHYKKGRTKNESEYQLFWRKRCDSILIRDKYLCQSCLNNGVEKSTETVTRIMPRSMGGTDWYTNLRAICEYCKENKSAQMNVPIVHTDSAHQQRALA
jgi:5-methylcytosine-specific restriction enzyme A